MVNSLKLACPHSGPLPLAVLLMQQFFSKNVTVDRADYLGRPAFKVAFTDSYQEYYRSQDVQQSSAYVTVPLTEKFYEGIIDVDIAAERNSYADNQTSRAFAGIAFRTQSSNKELFDLVYLRMTNGLLNNPPPSEERALRAIQYISSPKWTFDNLRQQFPGKYETGAKIAEKRWNHLRLIVKNNSVSAFIDSDSQPVLIANLLSDNPPGSIAFWVDDATTAYFSNLQIN